MATWNAEHKRWEWSEGELEGQIAASLTSETQGPEGPEEPSAAAIRFDRESRRYILELHNGTTFIFPADPVQGLRGASDDELAEVVIRPDGYNLHWPRLDQDFSFAGLMMGTFGSKAWMRQIRRELARQAAQSTSPKKARASAANGRLGGRPKKASG